MELTTDDANCGACGNACGDGASCVQGACVCALGNETYCDGVCATLLERAHCGACGNACIGDEVCTEDADHPRDCFCPGFVGTSCDGSCVDLQTDVAHCGACDNVCDGAAGNCNAGSCQCDDPSLVECIEDEACKNPSTDGEHCGGCGIACPPGEACLAGHCTCPIPGDAFCDLGMGYACVSGNDDAHCGPTCATCPAASQCMDTGVVFDCVCDDPGLIFCDGECVDPLTDINHCGGCGNVCTGAGPFETNSCDYLCDGATVIGSECGTFGLFGSPKHECP